MTPLCLDILLWYHCRAADYREGDFSAPAVREAIDRFVGTLNLLETVPPPNMAGYRTYRLTPRGQAYVDHVLSIPLPVCRWEIPGSVSA